MSAFISLFSGCGGFDLGFSKHFACLGAYDFEPSAVNTYNQNFPDEAFLHDLTDLNLPNMAQASSADILLSGSPCQGFSTIGRRRLDDPRNQLLFTAADVAELIGPKVVICENVPAVKSGKHSVYWEELINKLNRLGYKTEEFVYDFSRYGLAQIRKRIFLIAYRGAKVDRSLLELSTRESSSLKNVLAGVEHVSDHACCQHPKDTDIEIAKKIKPGQKLSNVRGGDNSVHSWDIPSVYGAVSESERALLENVLSLRRKHRVRDFGDADPVTQDILEKHHDGPYKRDLRSLIKKGYVTEKSPGFYDLKGAFNGKYRRLMQEAPSHTVDTNFGNPRYFLHPVENRGFSIREAARIQSFPDDFSFVGSLAQQYRMIGNAVPPMMSEQLAGVINDTFFGKDR